MTDFCASLRRSHRLFIMLSSLFLGGLASLPALENWQIEAFGLEEGPRGVRAMPYANGRFVAVYEVFESGASTARVLYSDDGETWIDSVTNLTHLFVDRVVAVNGHFAMASQWQGSTRIHFSENGVDWEQVHFGGGFSRDFTFFKGRYLNSYGGGGTLRYREADGTTWQNIATADQGITQPYYFGTGEDRLVLFHIPSGENGMVPAYSDDGLVWNPGTVTSSLPDFQVRGVAYHQGRFVAAGVFNATQAGQNAAVILTSSDGINWTSVEDLELGGTIEIAANESGFVIAAITVSQPFVPGGANPPSKPLIMESADGLNWETRIFDITYAPAAVAYGDGLSVVYLSRLGHVGPPVQFAVKGEYTGPTTPPGGEQPDPEPSTFWSTAESLGNDQYRFSWFGTFVAYPGGWIYHEEHGFLYPVAGNDSFFLYSESTGWLWSTPDFYPFLYRFTSTGGSWLYYFPGGTPQERWFYDFGAGDFLLL